MAADYNPNMLSTPEEYATPDQVKAMHEYSKALLQHSIQQPVHHWTQGLSNMVSALVGGYQQHRGGQRDRFSSMYDASKLPIDPGDTTATAPLSGKLSYAGMPEEHVAGIKNSEGFDPTAKWDVKQYSYGYGSRAPGPGHKVDQEGAERLLDKDLSSAAAVVDRVNPNLTPGTRSALISLTHNTGDNWVNSGLGKAVAAGDENAAKQHFMAYINVAGRPNSAIADRRKREASWFGQGRGEDAELPSNALAFDGTPSNVPPATDAPSAIVQALARGNGGAGPAGPSPGGPPIATRAAPGAGGPGAIDPSTLPHRVPVTRDQLVNIMASQRMDPMAKAMVLEQYYKQRQPQEAETFGGKVIIGADGKQRFIPVPIEKPIKGGGAEAPSWWLPQMGPQGPEMRRVPKTGGEASAPSATRSGTPPPATPPATPAGDGPSSRSASGGPPSLNDIPGLTRYAAEGDSNAGGAPLPAGGPLAVPPPEGSVPIGPKLAQTSFGDPDIDRMAQAGVDMNVQQKQREHINQKDFDSFDKKYAVVADAGMRAAQSMPQLQLAKEAINDPKAYSGIGADLVIDWKRFKAAIGSDPKAAAANEMFDKVISGSIVEDMKVMLQGLGQVRVAEINLLAKSAANRYNSKAANNAVLELTMRAHRQMSVLGDWSNAYREGWRLDGKGNPYKSSDVPTLAGYNSTMSRVIDKMPILSQKEIEHYDQLFEKEGYNKEKYDALRWREGDGKPRPASTGPSGSAEEEMRRRGQLK